MVWVLFVVMMVVVGLTGFLVGFSLGQERGIYEQRK